MPKTPNDSMSGYRGWIIAVGLAITVAVAVVFWQRKPLELDERGYDVATALYRVCNPRNVDGLEKIEKLLLADDESKTDLSESDSLIQ